MKKFKYKIESYLKFLKHQREAALTEVHKAQSYKTSLEQKYQWMDSEKRKAYEQNSKFGQGLNNIHLVQDNNNFIKILNAQMENLSQEISMAEEKYQEKYRALLQIQVKVKQIEIHREKKEKEYKKEVDKKIQKQLDDINSARTRRA